VEGLGHFPYGFTAFPMPKVWVYFRGDFKLKAFCDSILHGVLVRCQSLDTHSRPDRIILLTSEQTLSSNGKTC
jgi:hypothetical protein